LEKDGDILVIRAVTRQMNPTIDQSFVDEALEDDPAKAKAEWLAEFRDDIGGWADFALIEQAVDCGVTVRPPLADRKFKYWSFCDPSGGARDGFTAAIVHDENGIAVLDCLVEIKAPFNPTSAVAQIAAVLKSYGLSETVGDRYAAQWVVDAFANAGSGTSTLSATGRRFIWMRCRCSRLARLGCSITNAWSVNSRRWNAGRHRSARTALTTGPADMTIYAIALLARWCWRRRRQWCAGFARSERMVEAFRRIGLANPGGTGASDGRYGRSPSEFWRMVSDLGEK